MSEHTPQHPTSDVGGPHPTSDTGGTPVPHGDTGHPSMLEEMIGRGDFAVVLGGKEAPSVGCADVSGGGAVGDGGEGPSPAAEAATSPRRPGRGETHPNPETRTPEPDSALPDHREYDAAMKSLAAADLAGMAVKELVEARASLIAAAALLRKVVEAAGMEEGMKAMNAAGFDLMSEKRGPCDCGVPCCTKVRHTIEARCVIAGGRSVVVKFDVAEPEVMG